MNVSLASKQEVISFFDGGIPSSSNRIPNRTKRFDVDKKSSAFSCDYSSVKTG